MADSSGYAAAALPTGGSAGSSPANSPGAKDDRRMGTLLPPKRLPSDSRYSQLISERQRTLGSMDLAAQVKLPTGASEEEWLAFNAVELFNELNVLVGAILDLCTDQSCPMMSAGAFTWAWADGDQVKTPVHLTAPKYMETLLVWVEKQLADETFLPTKPGDPFPPTFRKGMKVIYKRMFRIYAHIFHSHFKAMADCDADAHLNHSFKHFVYYVQEFKLIDDAELEPMRDLVALYLRQRQQEQQQQ